MAKFQFTNRADGLVSRQKYPSLGQALVETMLLVPLVLSIALGGFLLLREHGCRFYSSYLAFEVAHRSRFQLPLPKLNSFFGMPVNYKAQTIGDRYFGEATCGSKKSTVVLLNLETKISSLAPIPNVK